MLAVRRRTAGAALLAAASVALVCAGCGGSDDASPSSGAVASAGHGGTLTWALADRPAELDPLFARSPSERLVSRQIHEPLIAELAGPFDDPRRVAGLALSARPTSDDRAWRLRLRPGVRFQDGTPLDARAVIANARRWQAQGRLPAEPELFAFSPRPGQVTFKLAVADPLFDRRLASPRLGVVSRRALGAAGSQPLTAAQAADSGTGPFELREHDADGLLMARNGDWWGSDHGLGPEIDQLALPVVADPAARVTELADGDLQVAAELDSDEARRLRRDPLLDALPDGYGTATGIERSVRGIPPRVPAPSLNAVWLTRIAPG
jgi:peptide/nickel transport system substrate-binding protein